MTETKHDMIQRIVERYDVPMMIDTHPLNREPVLRITLMDVINAGLDVGPGTTEHTRQQ